MTFWRKPPVEPEPLEGRPDPEQAWKVLQLVNDWVKYAETKLGIVLAATGVTGGVLFNLVKYRSDNGWVFNIAATACCAGVIIAGTCAIIGLFPILRIRRGGTTDTMNPIYFRSIADKYPGDIEGYGMVLHSLTTDPEELLRHLSQQIFANATVARRKYRWADRAVRALLMDLIVISVLAAISAIGA